MTDSNLKKACVVGHPIKHSRSPIIHNYWIKRYGLQGDYSKQEVLPEEFETWLLHLPHSDFVGCNITLPFKEKAFARIAVLDDTARAVEAVNTVWVEEGIVRGANTDVYGYLRHLDSEVSGWDLHVKQAVVLGAGGAARAIIYGLITRGIQKITVVNRSVEKAQNLIADFTPHTSMRSVQLHAAPWSEISGLLEGTDLLVNTTALGMTGSDPLNLSLKPMPKTAIVSDIVYAPLETELLRQAREQKLATVDGLGMLLHQAVPGFEKWFGIRPEVDADLRALVVADLNR